MSINGSSTRSRNSSSNCSHVARDVFGPGSTNMSLNSVLCCDDQLVSIDRDSLNVIPESGGQRIFLHRSIKVFGETGVKAPNEGGPEI